LSIEIMFFNVAVTLFNLILLILLICILIYWLMVFFI